MNTVMLLGWLVLIALGYLAAKYILEKLDLL